MLKKLSLISLLFLISCAHVTQVPITSSTQKRTLPSFNRIRAQGLIDIHLHTGKKRSQVILKGDPRDVASVVSQVQAGTLTLVVPPGFPHYGALHAEVHSKHLNGFSFHGKGIVEGKNIKSSMLNLRIANQGKTSLSGSLGIQRLIVSENGYTQISGLHSENLHLIVKDNPKIQLSGKANISMIDAPSGYISLYWVKSNSLTVRQKGNSVVQLAGVVDKLYVDLCEHACFKGRHLRANNAFVKAYGNSTAEISALHKQHSLATGQADIHFYELPDMRTDFMALNGSVLDMRDLSDPFLEEYTRYNISY